MWKALKTVGYLKTFMRDIMVFSICEAAQAKKDDSLGAMTQFAGEMLAMQQRSQEMLDAMTAVSGTVRKQGEAIQECRSVKSDETKSGFDKGKYE